MRNLMKRMLYSTAAVVVTAATPLTGLATTYPYRTHIEQNIDHHQVGWIDVAIEATGKVSITAVFSNGKQFAGNNFYSIATFLGKDGAVLHSVLQEKGLDGSWGGRAREGRVTSEFTLSPEKLADFNRIALKMGTRNCGLKVVEMHNLNDWTFSTDKCAVPDVPRPSPHRELSSGQK
jgi:hypothetical protein